MTLLREFKDGCVALRDGILNDVRPLVADGQPVNAAYIAQYWPGGALNERKDLKGWARCYGVLTGLARLKDRTVSATERAAKRAAVLEAIAETPEVVELVAKDGQGDPRTLTVYQKSDVALRIIHGINLQLASYIDDFNLLRAHGQREDIELLKRIMDEQGYLTRVIVWVATTKGPGLPFEESEQRPELPEEISALHSLDFYTVAQAFQRVNVVGFSALEASTAPKTRPDWSVFWSGLENESGKPAPQMMRDRGLLSLVATASELARGRREAEERAKRERKAG